MSKLVQSCFFGAQGQLYVNTAEPRRITQEDVGIEVGVSPGTVDRCLNGVGDPKTILAVKEAAERMGYSKVDKWASIKKEFIKGYDWRGRPEIDEEAICILRKRGNHARTISGITGISKKRIFNIFTKHGLSTENLQAIKENGLSKKQRIEVKALEAERIKQKNDYDFARRGSEIRKITLEIIKRFKRGYPIERVARELGIGKSFAFSCAYKTRSYRILKKRRKACLRGGVASTITFSKKYKNEAEMVPVVHLTLLEMYPDCEIEKEAEIADTFFGDRVRSVRADFVVKKKDGKIVAIEVKHATTTNSCKVLFGQCLIYKTYGCEVECVFPHDAFLSEFSKNVLNQNNIRFWTV